MSRDRIDLGKLGERIAGKHVASRGYKILERNFVTPFGEIDIIAEKNNRIVFFEVKTRMSEKFECPLSSITVEKQRHIRKNCKYYLKTCGQSEKVCRIDAIAVTLDRDKKLQVLEHVKNALLF